jgi:hypothetical protein
MGFLTKPKGGQITPQVFGVAQPPLNLIGVAEHLQTLGGCSATPKGGSKTLFYIYIEIYSYVQNLTRNYVLTCKILCVAR